MKCLAAFALAVFLACIQNAPAADAPFKKDAPPLGPVSYYKQIRPIFQANCQGCHQPAKAKGGYVMTDFAKLLAGGENKDKQLAIVPKNPSASLLVQQITPEKEKSAAEMPKGKPALAAHEIALISRWISEGAINDTPATTTQAYDAGHPPVYTLPPIVTSLDYSPDGTLLAVAGFHEVLLHKADGSGIAARLVGLSERIESVRFSPDGKLLAVAGGAPGRMGEIQVWDVETRKLKLSVPVTYDTVYGASWSPNAKQIAFGCSDLTVRAIDSETGAQVLQQGSHSDWVLDTAFNYKGDHIISVGRDMSAKLTEVATQRFVDNITSITPGALRGGLHSVSAHPTEDQVLVGGSDGAPQIYRIFRQTARKIGDNANLIRKFPEMHGRIFSVRFSKDGAKFAAASSLDNTGQIVIYVNDSKLTVPDNIKKIIDKEVSAQTPEDKIALDKFHSDGIKLISKLDVPTTGIYAVAFSPDGNTLAASGQDGSIRLIQTADGKVAKEFPAAPVAAEVAAAKRNAAPPAAGIFSNLPFDPESLPAAAQPTALEIQPASIKIDKPSDSAQLLVTVRLANGQSADVTRMVKYALASNVAEISARGQLNPLKNGSAKLTVSLGALKSEIPVEISGQDGSYKYDFIRDVNPILSKVGCNAGTCHGAKEGKNGFKLSLRGYDPILDVRAFGDDLASRRINAASPDDSLMLLKPVAAVPHEGGQRLKYDDRAYRAIRDWIAAGSKLNLETPRVVKLDIAPKDPVIQAIGSKQQVRVIATYANGDVRDVTGEAFIDSGNTDVASVDSVGLVKTLRRGEAPMLARYEGNYAATTVTVMGDRRGFVWLPPETYSRADELVADKWKRMQIQPSELCTDFEFIRRVYLDLTGLPPSGEEVAAFLADTRDSRVKRDELTDKLIGSPEFVDHWANKWADLLQVNRKFLGTEGAQAYREWIRKQIDADVPYDQFARSILTATGSNKENPPASYFKVLRTPDETMENTTHLFLATRFNCNKCHDHPFERWTQNQYYETAAFFAQIELKKDPASGDKNIGGTAVEGAKPLYEIIGDKKSGEETHLRTGKVAPPQFPYPAKFEVKNPDATRREKLAAWITSPDNRYFATSYVNRLWGYLTGVGIIEPLDDIRAGNPPTNPELLDYLTKEFIEHNFDMRHIVRLICKSRTYQLSITPNKWNKDDKTNYSHALARRLPAEVLLDAVFKVTGSQPNFPGVKPGTRAAQLPDSGIDLPSGILANLGRPPRESACECERSNDMGLGSVMSLLSGPSVSDAIDNPKNWLAEIVKKEADDRKLIDAIYFRVLNRAATPNEIETALKSFSTINGEHQKLVAALDAMEKQYVPIIAEQERKRLESIDKAKTTLADYEKASAPKLAEDERKRQERIAASEKALKDYEPKLLDALVKWEKGIKPEQLAGEWAVLEPKTVTADGGVKLEIQKDSSILASGPNPNTTYTITAETALANITGFKLEVLTDPSLPKTGPGRAGDGNFVLNEFKLDVLASKDDKKGAAAKFKDARADFTQANFDVKKTIDGKLDTQKGWALSGGIGKDHQATFQLEKPIAEVKAAETKPAPDAKAPPAAKPADEKKAAPDAKPAEPKKAAEPKPAPDAKLAEPKKAEAPKPAEKKDETKSAAPAPKPAADPKVPAEQKTAADAKPSTLKFTLIQRYADSFSIGHFKLWVTTSSKPLEFGLPALIVAVLKIEPANRTKEQGDTLLEYFKTIDPELQKLKQALATSKQPLPVDPKLVELKAAVTNAEQPIKIEPKLIQMRLDVPISAAQLTDKRLTGAQDLTWALINSPAFLFNH